MNCSLNSVLRWAYASVLSGASVRRLFGGAGDWTRLVRPARAQLFDPRFGAQPARPARLSRSLADPRLYADQLSALQSALENAGGSENQVWPESRDRVGSGSAGHDGNGREIHPGKQNHRDHRFRFGSGRDVLLQSDAFASGVRYASLVRDQPRGNDCPRLGPKQRGFTGLGKGIRPVGRWNQVIAGVS